jgi:hypothetical protein
MSFNSRTCNWKIMEGDPSFCNENNIKKPAASASVINCGLQQIMAG